MNLQQNYEQAFHEKRVAQQMNRFYQKEHNKMLGLQEAPKVTKKLVEEYITFQLKAQVPIKFNRIVETPETPLWRHACMSIGIGQLPVTTTQLYGVPISYIACAKCLTVNYTYTVDSY